MRRAIHDLTHAEPFVPFVIVMNSGDRYAVHDPRMAIAERDILNVYRYRSNRKDILRLAEISALEVLDPDDLP